MRCALWQEYRSDVPILLRWLPQISDGAVKEDIARTLPVPWAKPAAAHMLIAEFKNAMHPHGDGLHWAIVNGLAVAGDDSVFEHLIELIQDGRSRKACEMLALALAYRELQFGRAADRSAR